MRSATALHRASATGLTVALLSLLACAAGAQAHFTDATEELLHGVSVQPRGVALADWNNDGRPDLFISPGGQEATAQLALYASQGDGRLADRNDALPLPGGLVAWSTWPGGGPGFADYDNDGDLDLHVPLGLFASNLAEQNLLLRNDNGVFQRAETAAALTDRLPTDNAIWLDFDRDGWVDVYNGNLEADRSTTQMRNRLYRNRGDGTFADVTTAVGLDVALQTAGGSNGGLLGADFNGDGWPDLYVGVYEAANRLFLSDGSGRFADATTDAIGDRGQAFGAAAGDFDNDGDLDIFQAAGGGGAIGRSPLLRNDGQGQFEDVLEAAGLSALASAHILEAALADIDNDGDLDLLTGQPLQVFLNNGDGTFGDGSAASGLVTQASVGLAVADIDRDGFLDVVAANHIYRNDGNGNHWLQVELLGTRSNRCGINARVTALAGGVSQLREVLGGRGYCQDEPVAHFGLGDHPIVDRLEVRWPSGQVDVVEGVVADQRVRVIEGQPGYQPVGVTQSQIALPDSVVEGRQVTVSAWVRPDPLAAGATYSVAADLSELGGPSGLTLTADAEGTYWLPPTRLGVVAAAGVHPATFRIDQSAGGVSRCTIVAKPVLVAPAEDLLLYADGPAAPWLEPAAPTGTTVDSRSTALVYRGQSAMAVTANGFFKVTLKTAEPVLTSGYTALRFRFHPGAATLRTGGGFTVKTISYVIKDAFGADVEQAYTAQLLGGRNAVPGTGMDMAVREWQDVVLPFTALQYQGRGGLAMIESIVLSGSVTGTFYLDDISLMTAAAVVPEPTAVEDDQAGVAPSRAALLANYPNPFNSATAIGFTLRVASQVELAVFNLAGQQVATLVRGRWAAGTHRSVWDATDDHGCPLASGIYVARLRTGDARQETRKLLLLR